jgi:hypothetical protein
VVGTAAASRAAFSDERMLFNSAAADVNNPGATVRTGTHSLRSITHPYARAAYPGLISAAGFSTRAGSLQEFF